MWIIVCQSSAPARGGFLCDLGKSKERTGREKSRRWKTDGEERKN